MTAEIETPRAGHQSQLRSVILVYELAHFSVNMDL